MVALWCFAFLCGALVGSYTSHFTLQAYYEGLAVGGVAGVYLLTPRLRWVRRMLVVGSAFLWGAVHQAPSGSSKALQHTVAGPLLQPAIVIHHSSGGQSRPLIVAVGEHAYLARGEATRGRLGSLVASPGRGLLNRQRYFFMARPTRRPQLADDALSRATRALAQTLQAMLQQVPIAQRGWLAVLVLGDFRSLSPELMAAFRHLGLFHLLAISGMHITFLAIALRRLLSSPFLLLYSCGLLSPRTWLHCRHGTEVVLLVGLFLYVSVLGQGQAAQRALLVYGLNQLGLMCWGMQPLAPRLQLSVLLQTLLFPIAFLSEATLMSWSAYIVVLSFSGLKLWSRDLLRLLTGQAALFLVVGALWGEASPVGIVVNFVLTPLFPAIFFLSLLSLIAPQSAVGTACQQITNGFNELLLGVDHFLAPLGALRYMTGLSYSCRLLFLGAAAIIFLTTWRQLSIRGGDGTTS